jgi:DNA-binding GntR family transcriptional regulator
MEAALPIDDLGIAARIQRAKGRAIRSQIKALRVTPDEENELLNAANSEGKVLGEWIRDVLLQQARSGRTEAAVITEIVALRMLLNNVLRPLALGESMTPEQYSQVLSEVRNGKRDAAREVLAQYSAPRPKER